MILNGQFNAHAGRCIVVENPEAWDTYIHRCDPERDSSSILFSENPPISLDLLSTLLIPS